MTTLTITKQPPSTELPSLNILKDKYERIKFKVTTKKGWFGDYDYGWLCTPTLPFRSKDNRDPPFYGLDDELPLILAITVGFQHALGMLSGLIIAPLAVAASLNLSPDISAYMIASSLISTGIISYMQISRIRLFKNYYLGTGLISVVGTATTTLTIADSIFNAMYNDGTCPSSIVNGVVVRGPCPDGYGKILGTSIICSFLEIFMSFCSPRALRRIFPPLVTGTCILLIGASLIGSFGIPNWGGGSSNCQTRPESGFYSLCPNTAAPHALPWGSAEFVGLGFLSFASIVITEFFGSPFLKNTSLIVGLLVGCIVAAATGYIDSSAIDSAPAITFLWVHRFKLGIYPSSILPFLAVYAALGMDAIGNITATAEVSRQPVIGDEFNSRIQGGLLSDGIGGLLAALLTTTPLTTFAPNNGIISITRCANRSAGRWCCLILILCGIFGKLSGVFLAIPAPVLGGVITFLFGSVMASGLRVLAYIKFTRRDRFILAAALSFGTGSLLKPEIFTHLFDEIVDPSNGLKGLCNSIVIVLTTPFLFAGIVATILCKLGSSRTKRRHRFNVAHDGAIQSLPLSLKDSEADMRLEGYISCLVGQSQVQVSGQNTLDVDEFWLG